MHIAIIGAGGAGLSAAWLLEGEHRVTLFEKDHRLGGHADTIQVELEGQVFHIDAGFEFLSTEMFPVFIRWLGLLEVPLRRFPMTVSFYTTDHKRMTVLPPLRDGKIVWSGLRPGKLVELLQFRAVLRGARRLMRERDLSITVEDYIEGRRLSKAFKEGFLYPFLLAGWCLDPEEHRRFMAYNVLRYAYMHQPAGLAPFYWLDIDGGTRTYVQAVANSLQNTTVLPDTSIVGLEKKENGWLLKDPAGRQWEADHVVLATNAYEASRILSGLDTFAGLRSELDRIEYFQTRIAVHGDKRLMPEDERNWSVANIRYDGRNSSNSIWKYWRMDGRPIFKSWVTHEKAMPEPLYAQASYWHPRVNAGYFKAQKNLREYQGQDHLWLAGMYTHDVDCHESAVVSGVQIAQRLAPRSRRLNQLNS